MKSQKVKKIDAKMKGPKPKLKTSKAANSKNKKPLHQAALPMTQASFKEPRDRYAFGKLPSKQTPSSFIKALKKLKDAGLLLQLLSK